MSELQERFHFLQTVFHEIFINRRQVRWRSPAVIRLDQILHDVRNVQLFYRHFQSRFFHLSFIHETESARIQLFHELQIRVNELFSVLQKKFQNRFHVFCGFKDRLHRSGNAYIKRVETLRRLTFKN